MAVAASDDQHDDMAPTPSVHDSYDAYEDVEEPFQARLDESLEPRGPASLFEIVASLGLRSGARAVDVGCGRGEAAIELASRFGMHVVAVDPVQRPQATGRAAARAAGVDDHVRFERGTAEQLPLGDDTVDFVWCKEALTFTDVPRAFAEIARVLRPGGVGLAYQVLTGARMSAAEAEAFWSASAGRNVRPADVEAAIAAAGLVLGERIDFAGEWGEWGQERSGAAGRRLLHAARLLRDPERYIAEFGEVAYEIMLGDCLWHVYRMIGKLHGVAFVFAKAR